MLVEISFKRTSCEAFFHSKMLIYSLRLHAYVPLASHQQSCGLDLEIIVFMVLFVPARKMPPREPPFKTSIHCIQIGCDLAPTPLPAFVTAPDIASPLQQPGSRADPIPSEKSMSGDGEDGIEASSEAEKTPPVAGHDDSFTVASSEKSLVDASESPSDISDDGPSPKASAGGNKESMASTVSAYEEGCGIDYSDSFAAALVQQRSFDGDAKGVLIAAESGDSAVAEDDDGAHFVPTLSDGSLLAGGIKDGLSTLSSVEGSLADDWSEDPGKTASEGSLEDDHSSEKSFGGDCASTDTASSGEVRMDTVVPPSEVTGRQVNHNLSPLHHAAVEAVTSEITEETTAIEKIEKTADKDRRGLAQGHQLAGAWLGSEKWNMAASAGQSLRPSFRALRIWTTPPKGWDCGSEGRWVVKKPPPSPSHSCQHQSPLPKKGGAARNMGDGETAAVRWSESERGWSAPNPTRSSYSSLTWL